MDADSAPSRSSSCPSPPKVRRGLHVCMSGLTFYLPVSLLVQVFPLEEQWSEDEGHDRH